MPQEKTKAHTLKAVPKSSTDANSIDLSVCPKCFGTGMEVVPDKGARICDCRKNARIEKRKSSDQFPKRYAGCTFENYKIVKPSQKTAMGAAFVLATQFPAIDKGLLLMGPVGVGKTHLAVSLAKVIANRGFSCVFYEFGTLLKEIRDSFNPSTQTSEISILDPVLKADVLILDELGASKPTDWVRETLYHIINTRYNEKRVTVFTTNYLDEREEMRLETLEDRVGVAIRSRLYEMCKTVVINAPDYRKAAPEAAI